jgi:hypothetical protein
MRGENGITAWVPEQKGCQGNLFSALRREANKGHSDFFEFRATRDKASLDIFWLREDPTHRRLRSRRFKTFNMFKPFSALKALSARKSCRSRRACPRNRGNPPFPEARLGQTL